MPENAMLMLHDPSGLVMGTATDMRAMAEALDKMEAGMVAAYRDKSGRDDVEIKALMQAETWLSAQEAVAFGLADRVEEPVHMAAHFDLSRFRKPPPQLVAMTPNTSPQEDEMPDPERKRPSRATPAAHVEQGPDTQAESGPGGTPPSQSEPGTERTDEVHSPVHQPAADPGPPTVAAQPTAQVIDLDAVRADERKAIRDDGLIEGADPTIAALTGRIDVRFADTTLIDLAAEGTPVDLEFGYTHSAQAKLVLTAHEVYLPKPKLAVEGPGGVQASFDFRGAKNDVAGRMLTVTLTNDLDGAVSRNPSRRARCRSMARACRADLGDDRCRFPIKPPLLERAQAVQPGAFYRVATGMGAGFQVYEDRIYEVTAAGTTNAVAPTYDTTIGNPTIDGTATLTARDSFVRVAVVETVTSNRVFTANDVLAAYEDHWFASGALTFETGANAGRTLEIKSWTQVTRSLELWEPARRAVQVGDQFRLYAGCSKRVVEDCRDKFQIPGSLLFAQGNAKNFRGEPYVPGGALVAQAR